MVLEFIDNEIAARLKDSLYVCHDILSFDGA